MPLKHFSKFFLTFISKESSKCFSWCFSILIQFVLFALSTHNPCQEGIGVGTWSIWSAQISQVSLNISTSLDLPIVTYVLPASSPYFIRSHWRFLLSGSLLTEGWAHPVCFAFLIGAAFSMSLLCTWHYAPLPFHYQSTTRIFSGVLASAEPRAGCGDHFHHLAIRLLLQRLIFPNLIFLAYGMEA